MNKTICAIATAQGGAIGIIRVSGPDAIRITDTIFRGRRSLLDAPGYSVHFGQIITPNGPVLNSSAVELNPTPVPSVSSGSVLNSSAVELTLSPSLQREGRGGSALDEVLVTVFRAPHSYTGEDSVEISCHGSSYILQTICQLLISQGCQQAGPGEYTQRAFLNGKMDLSQAEAVADLIASQNAAQHRVAMNQLRGGISTKLHDLRDRLLHLTSLLELELDFSDHEDLEFADRTELISLSSQLSAEISKLISSFSQGNAIKNGIPVAIIGAPNVGKSTLLNALLQDDKAIVSDIQGTTRDTIEDTIYISSVLGSSAVEHSGALFRFIDTAGIRHTDDTIEQLGIERSIKAAERAQIIILMRDPDHDYPTLTVRPDQTVIRIYNKSDQRPATAQRPAAVHCPATAQRPASGSVLSSSAAEHILLSAKTGTGLDTLKTELLKASPQGNGQGETTIITNLRHKQALDLASEDIHRAIDAMNLGISGDLIAEDLRQCIIHLSEIVGGAITPDEVLGNIFKHFCIGK